MGGQFRGVAGIVPDPCARFDGESPCGRPFWVSADVSTYYLKEVAELTGVGKSGTGFGDGKGLGGFGG